MRWNTCISIHALLAESDATNHDQVTKAHQISIHALLAESDESIKIGVNFIDNFYPRSPCGERLTSTALLLPPTKFLSTLSLRRATRGPPEGQTGQGISIHALLAESDANNANNAAREEISIHALLAESD